MTPLQSTWRDYRDAARAFSRPARLYLFAEFLAWTGHGIQGVLFNLYLVEAGFKEAFVGNAISMAGLGLAVAALPAGIIAERWGRRRCLMLGVAIEGAGLLGRSVFFAPGVIVASSFVMGAGQSMFQIAAAPFITEHSTPRERTHLFSTFFAAALFAGVVGSGLGGLLPAAMLHLPQAMRPTPLVAFRIALVVASLISLSGWLPLARLRGLAEASLVQQREAVEPGLERRLWPIALNFLLIGCGAGLVIPFMNLYFKDRFGSSSAQIGAFFATAQVLTAFASLLGPAIARRFGKLRTAVASELMSLPFLVTLGAERRLPVAVASFWARATLMQAATPLMQNFVMEALPPGLRARSSSINNMVWNIGWAVSATCAGLVIQHWGFAVPFYMTACLYATAAITFFLSFRRVPETQADPRISEEAKGLLGEGPMSD